MQKPSVLLAYGEKEFSRSLQKALEERRYTATILSSGQPPKASYDFIIQLASDPTDLTQGTRLLLEKMVKDRARFFLVAYRSDEQLYQESLRFAQSLTRDFERKFAISVNILRLGRLFGPQIAKDDSGALGFLVHEFTEGEILTIYGGGEEKDYYLYADDAYAGIAHALGKAENGVTYSIAPQAATSALSIAKLLSELGEGRHEIHYHRGLVALDEQGAVEGEPLPQWREKFSLREGILEILKARPAAVATPHRPTIPSIKLPVIPIPRLSFKKPSPTFLKIALIALLLLSPIIYLGAEAAFAFYQLTRAKDEAAGFNFPAASSSARQAAAGFERIERWEKIIPPLGSAAVGKEVALAASELTENGGLALTTLENLINSRQGLSINSQSDEQFRSLVSNFSSAEDHLSLALIEARRITNPFPKEFVQTIKTDLESSLLLAKFGRSFWSQASELLGYKGERNFLIFFQNSAEIWPGGGFVGSLANVLLKDGGIKNLTFYDIYDFSQYQNSLNYPAIRVSYDPDFSQNAKLFAEVFERANGISIDGAFGIDLHFAQELLKVTGPITLSDFNREITVENFFEVTTEEVEKDFFPGSAKKKRFMQALGEAVLSKLFSINRTSYAAVAQLAWEKLREKGILLYFANPHLSLAVAEAGFGGLVEQTEGDYLMVTDHSTGGKGTIWVKRDIRYRVFNVNQEGRFRSELTITWTNEGSSSWPAGAYGNDLRILVPLGTTLEEAQLEETSIIDQIAAYTSHNKTAFAYTQHIRVDPGSTQTIKFLYNLPNRLDLDNLSVYLLLLQKQPGMENDTFSFIFEKPFGFSVAGFANGRDLQKDDQSTGFDGNLDQDLNFEIQLTKK